ncbi:LOW QUALITY PROTEIN: G-patch domain and KOW motifs-containing protein [Anomalospiza imberbis]|uniref:LOW QUALITY PROTEIN: G-patch domain and KOW motifs-containing protein n=1 Tax=Anomalospiza imberbis TaxID=187417 RepID=UPI00358E5524
MSDPSLEPWDPQIPPWDPQSDPTLGPPACPPSPRGPPDPPQIPRGPPAPPCCPQTPQDYEAVPVGQFGLAMLRGMGWSQGQGIGRTFARVVPPLEQRPRPRGLGLGAEAAPPGAGEPPQGGLGVGDAVSIEAGPHRGLRGQVQALLPEAGRALVRLQLGGQVVTVSQHALRPAGSGARSSPGAPPPAPPPHWLRRDLRVRCVDTAFRGGAFYNCKMRIEDLLAPDTCVCRTDDGHLVEGLREASLETVVPRGSSERVMVVLGEHAGQTSP